MKVDLFTAKGIKKSSVELPKAMTEGGNPSLFAQAIRVYENRSHPGLSKTKTRSEVNISKRKIYRQKGTGNARHGAKSAPIFVGGGTAHGPKGLKRLLSLSKSIKINAKAFALSQKIKNQEVVIVDKLSSIEKTKEASFLINKLFKDIKLKDKVLVLVADNNRSVKKFFRNIMFVNVKPVANLNASELYRTKYLLFDGDALQVNKKIKTDKNKI